MAKFRKKPVVVEAIQWDGTIEHAKKLSEIFGFECYIGTRTYRNNFVFYIKTLENWVEASPNDWIIKGVQGECYPCKPDIFEQTYEATE